MKASEIGLIWGGSSRGNLRGEAALTGCVWRGREGEWRQNLLRRTRFIIQLT
jgi:hypothetical protein